MFGHYSYLLYTLIFALPLVIFLWIYYWQIIKEEWKVISIVTIGILLYVTILWIYALTSIHVWWYASEKVLGIRIGGWVLEDTLWWIIILLLEISVVVIFMKKQDRGKFFFKRE